MNGPNDNVNKGNIPTMRFHTEGNLEPGLRVTRVSWFDLESNRRANATYGINESALYSEAKYESANTAVSANATDKEHFQQPQEIVIK